MQASFRYDRETITLRVPDSAIVYESRFPSPADSANHLVRKAWEMPIAAANLRAALAQRRTGDVVVVVSDISRPIPYAALLPQLLAEIESVGVPRSDILILIATGNHRSSTPAERVAMFGPEVAAQYRIEDHRSESSDLIALQAPSWSGATVRLNRSFVKAGFRLITGLVEPHFMAGFSGGRKAVCPGLTALATVKQFHGQKFLADPHARNGMLEGNPLHEEALSVARQIGVDFSLNVVLNKDRQVIRAFAGELDAAHRAACTFVRQCACPAVVKPADVAITSSGGDPLDTTFYQCVKGFVSATPAVREGGMVIAFGGCREGVGSSKYQRTMFEYATRWRDFLNDIQRPNVFIKDQWQFQMHCRSLAKIGQQNLHFVTSGLPQDLLSRLNVHGHAVADDEVKTTLQSLLDRALLEGQSVAVFPEGPYCAPIADDEHS
ncbi:MAG: nickel-dependent lactate racemase [Phycisphaeraceae bacterium]|nr:nickel-dependent lactate racemase [Phycisphaeraceae bacterium]